MREGRWPRWIESEPARWALAGLGLFASAAGAGSVSTEGRTVPIQRQTADLSTFFEADQLDPALAIAPNGSVRYLFRNVGRGLGNAYWNPAGVNFSAGNSAGDRAKPEIATRRDGESFLVWEDTVPSLGDSDLAIVGQFWSSFVWLRINDYTTGFQQNADIAAGSAGDFVVVWQSTGSVGSDASGDSIQCRHVGADGTLGQQYQVNSNATGDQAVPAVAAREGGYVAVWYGIVGHDPNGFGVAMRLLGPDCAPLGAGDLPVNAGTADSQGRADVAVAPQGDIVVVWESESSGGDDDGLSIQVRHFDSLGTPVGGDSQVNQATAGDQGDPAIAAGRDGRFLVVWASADSGGPDLSPLGIRGQELSIGESLVRGIPADLQINTYTSGTQRNPSVAADLDGNYVVAWESDGSPESDEPIRTAQHRRLAAAGDLLTGLIAYWDFDTPHDGDLPDRVGSLDGTLHGTTEIFEHFSREREFDAAASDYIDLSGVGPVHAISGSEVTVAGWVRLDVLPSALAESFVGIFDAVDDNYVLYLDKANQELRFKVTNSVGSAARPGIPQGRLVAGKWTHVAGVFDGSVGEARIYLDGVLMDTEALTGNVRSVPAQIPAFGRNGGGAAAAADQYYFDGALDDFAIWNRALSLEEIRYLRSDEIFSDGFEIHISLWSAAVGI